MARERVENDAVGVLQSVPDEERALRDRMGDGRHDDRLELLQVETHDTSLGVVE